MHKGTFLPPLNHYSNRQTINLMITVNLIADYYLEMLAQGRRKLFMTGQAKINYL